MFVCMYVFNEHWVVKLCMSYRSLYVILTVYGVCVCGFGHPSMNMCVCCKYMCFTLVCVHGRACCVQCRVLPKLQATSAGGCSLITVINLASDRG